MNDLRPQVIDEEIDFVYCPNCHGFMNPVYENVGFKAPDPEKWVLDRYTCRTCRRTIAASDAESGINKKNGK